MCRGIRVKQSDGLRSGYLLINPRENNGLFRVSGVIGRFILCPVLLFLVCVSQGCLPTYYHGIRGAETPPFIMPLRIVDGQQETCFTFGGWNARHFNEEEDNSVFRARIVKVRTRMHTAVNTGFGIHYGNYRVERVDKFRGSKFYFGAGPEVSALFFRDFGRLTTGIGFTASLGVELGDYYRFRRDSDKEGLADNNVDPIYMMLSLFPYFGWPAGKNTRISMQYALGLPGGLSPVVSVRHKTCTIWVSVLPFSVDDDSGNTHVFVRTGIGVKL